MSPRSAIGPVGRPVEVEVAVLGELVQAARDQVGRGLQHAMVVAGRVTRRVVALELVRGVAPGGALASYGPAQLL